MDRRFSAFGIYVLDRGARQLLCRGVEVHLEPKVMDLLLYLVENRDRCVSKEELLRVLWPSVSVGEASVTRLVKKLRASLRGPGAVALLRTVHGRGYQFVGSDAVTLRGSSLPSPPGSSPCAELHVGPCLAKILEPLEHAAISGLPVVLEGEAGTGKASLGRALHAWSGRQGELVTLCCARVTEAELDGAFARARPAEHTLLLREFDELPQYLQSRVLTHLSHEDVARPESLLRRIVVTAQRSLSAMVEQRRLRGDVLARLDGIRVEVPPLRQRREDIGGLIDFFRARSGDAKGAPLPEPVLRRLSAAYDWPFNVIELEMFVLRWLALGESGFDRALPAQGAGSLM